MTTYRVGILGCRARGTIAARAYHAHPRCEIVGLCDLLADRRSALGDELGIDARFGDVEEMIRQTAPDIVAIPTGTEFHFDLGMQVVSHGIHIDIEKPICVDLIQADALIDRAKKQNARIAVHHQGRSGAALQAVSRALREGKIGALRHISASGKGYYGGYGLMNIGTHSINAMLELTGPCREVSALIHVDGRAATPDDVLPSPSGMGVIVGEDITATFGFDHRVTATLRQHRFPAVDSTAHGFEVLGTEGRLFWRNTSAWWMPTAHDNPEVAEANWTQLEMVYPEHFDPGSGAVGDEYLYVDEYVRALDEGRDHCSSGVEGRHVLEVMMAIFESGISGKHVSMPQANREHPLIRWRREADRGALPDMPRAYGEWLEAEGIRLGWTDADRMFRVNRI